MRRALAAFYISLALAAPAVAFASTFTDSQIQALLSLFSSFGVDQSTVTTVSHVLGGGNVTTPKASSCDAPAGATCIPGTNIIQPLSPGNGYTPGFGGGGNTPAPAKAAFALSSVSKIVSAYVATSTWTTNEAADSKLLIGTTTSYGTTYYSSTLTTSHSIAITGLTSGTTYHYQVVSVDAAGDAATSSDQTFTTTTGDTVVAFLTSGTAWTVPFDWSSTSNSVELIGGGAAGYNQLAGVNGAGGGGGAYVKESNLTLTPGATISIQVGQGGLASATSSGSDTIFNSSGTSCAGVSSPALCAQGGKVSDGTSAGGLGGSASSSVGTIKNGGGAGGSNCDLFGCDGNGGGGGAGGPNGAGAAGGLGSGNNWEAVGGGGGGADGGSVGTNGTTTGGNGGGGAGGNNFSGTGGGIGGAALGAAGTAGTNGGGGGGGGNPDYGTNDAGPGGVGGNGIEWDATHGSGGGGGAAGNDNRTPSFTNGVGGNGGLYGGGGGGGNPGGNGAQGIIVVTYNASTAACSQAQDFLSRVSGVDAVHAQAYTKLICGLVNDGIWNKLDVFYVFATQNSTIALANLLNSSFTATASGTPTFGADSGYVVSSGNFISSNYNFATNGTKFTQNSASFGGWSGSTGASFQYTWGDSLAFSGNEKIKIKDPIDGTTGFSINDLSAENITGPTDASGMFGVVRSDSASEAVYRNGTLLGSVSHISSAPDDAVFETGGDPSGSGSYSGTIRAMFAGGALTATDASNFYGLMQNYMNAVGATP